MAAAATGSSRRPLARARAGADERRRVYRLTPSGRALLKAEAARLEAAVGLARSRRVLTRRALTSMAARIAQLLLLLYPPSLRREHGPEMALAVSEAWRATARPSRPWKAASRTSSRDFADQLAAGVAT